MDADLRGGVGVSLSQLKISLDSLWPPDEKTYRCHECQVRKYGKLRQIRHGKGGDGEHVFARKMQGGLAGHENAEVGQDVSGSIN